MSDKKELNLEEVDQINGGFKLFSSAKSELDQANQNLSEVSDQVDETRKAMQKVNESLSGLNNIKF